MAKRVQFIRHDGAAAQLFLGLQGEVTVDLSNNSLRVHDALNAGGVESARADLNNTQTASTSTHGKMSAQQVSDLETVIIDLAAEIVNRTNADLTKAALAVPTAAGNIAVLTALGDLEDSEKSFTSTDDKVDNFPAGTLMLFPQTAAPTGWTKSTTHNDKALRIVSGAAGSGGTSPFSTVFGLTATDAHTLLTAEIPSHSHGSAGAHVHDVVIQVTSEGGAASFPHTSISMSDGDTVADFSNAIVSGGAHTHPAAGGGGSHAHDIDLQIQYVDTIIASKD